MRDRARGFAGGELGEDTAHDGGLGLVDFATAADRFAPGVVLPNDVVTETQSTARPSVAHPALKTAANLLRKVLQEERVHCALQADMEFADLALGEGEQAHASEAQSFEQARDILLVARQAVERLGYDHVELAVSRVF